MTKENNTAKSNHSGVPSGKKEGTYGGSRYRLNYDKFEKNISPDSDGKRHVFRWIGIILLILALGATGFFLYKRMNGEISGCIDKVYSTSDVQIEYRKILL